MADDAKKVAAELVNAKCGIIAFPFYSKFDIDAASGDTAFDREAALLQWQACEGSVLVSTTLGVHGLNYRDVDLIAHLMIPTDIRTYWQAANRACRTNQRGRAIQTISAEYIQDASWSVDCRLVRREARGGIPRDASDYRRRQIVPTGSDSESARVEAIHCWNMQQLLCL